MKVLITLSLFILVSCAQIKESRVDSGVAFDSMAEGKIKASAVKKFSAQNVCFLISLSMSGVEQRIAAPSNWTVVWIDKASRYHLLSVNQRDPASIPQKGSSGEWKNTFRTCAPKAQLPKVEAIILTPKELPYKETEGLRLEWN